MNVESIIAQAANDTLTFLVLPIYVAAILVELRINKRQQLNLYERKDSIASIWMLAITAAVEIAPKLVAFYVFYQLHELSPLRDVIQRQWWAWLLLFVLDDFVYYWFHRLNHVVRIFWAGHVSHHSAIKMNYGTALRQGVGERLHKFFFWLPLALLGFDPLMIFTVIGVNLFYQFWVHTELLRKMPPAYEFIFNTPSHHRVHHASNIRYLDTNHGGVFILWDRLFGSFSAENDDEPPVYGLTENISSYHPVYVATHEYQAIWRDLKRATTWRARFRYLFDAPGWSHDGEDKRSSILRAKL